MKTENFDKLLVSAIEQRILQIRDEEIAKCVNTIRDRITNDCIGLAPTILRSMNWSEHYSGEVTIKFKAP